MKKKRTVGGYSLIIEYPAGSVRRGTAPDGMPWEREMAADYGHIALTEGADGEPLDVYLLDGGSNGAAPLSLLPIYVIDQVRQEDGVFDEHKVILGAQDIEEARRVYLAHYPEDWRGLGAITFLTEQEFARFYRDPARSKHPVALNHGRPVNDAAEDLTEKERDGIDAEDFAGPDRTFPIRNAHEVEAAAKLYGRAADPAAVKRRIIAIAKRKGLSAHLPQDWRGSEERAEGDSSSDDILTAVSGEYELLALPDGDPRGGILRVRHLATIADAVNINSRVYPRGVLQQSIEDARPRARAGAMLSEYRHPSVVRVDGEQKYVDNHDRKSARVDDISDVSADGSVYVTRTILDTPAGRAVADAYRAGNPLGVSVRWKMRGRPATVAGRRVMVADSLIWANLDDVENPAVAQTLRDYQLLTDEMRAEIGLPASLDPAAAGPSLSPAPDERERKSKVKDAIKKKIDRLRVLLAVGKTAEAKALADEVRSHLLLAADADEDVRAEADDLMQLAGYEGDRPGPRAVSGAETGSASGGSGFAAGMEKEADEPKETEKADGDGLTAAQSARVKAMLEREDQAAADAAQKKAVADAIEACRTDVLKGLSNADQDAVVRAVQMHATQPDAVRALMDSTAEGYRKAEANRRLASVAGGGNGAGSGNTVQDPASRVTGVTERGPEWMGTVDKLLAAADDTARHSPAFGVDPDSSFQQSIRRANRPVVDRLVREWVAKREGTKSWEEWVASCDAEGDPRQMQALSDAIGRVQAVYDSTTLSNLYNQPAIATALLIQQFQDLEALQVVEAVGPGADSPNGPNWMFTGNTGPNHIGSVLRIPIEYWNEPGGYGASGPQDDMGLLTPEGVGIDEGTAGVIWDVFAPAWRRIAASMTRDGIVAMGQGPLNYSVVGRHLFHMGYAKQRRIDKALLNEMLDTADEYAAVAVANESVSLANNSVFPAAGAVTVNLNPAKTAAAAVAATDAAVTYGAGVIGAVRLVGNGAGTYFGTALGAPMIVKPRVKVDLTASGQITSSTLNPISVSAPAGAHRGYLDANGSVATFAGDGTAATYAVDYNNGVIVFASGVAGAGGVLTTAVTASYSYATNFDEFALTPPAGVEPSLYRNRLLEQFDSTGAKMGSAPRFVKPNLAIMSLNASVNITTAQIFYKLQSPDGTSLFPSESFFFERTGIMGMRVNSPWRVGDTRALLSRRGTTKYGIGVAFEARGPYPAYDGSTPAKIVAKDIYYGEEYSTIATPQTKDANGNVINPVSRSIRFR